CCVGMGVFSITPLKNKNPPTWRGFVSNLGLHRQMKAFFHAHTGAFGRRARRPDGCTSSNAMRHAVVCTDLRGLPYLARNICGHLVSLGSFPREIGIPI
ncbi:hypothetical protein, partial [Burkholderia mallei]